ncbi:MAG: response regulator transcription factor [Clostridiales bacterium]|nr:response regulator transcription factor [Clostridiales bacterium]
MEKILIVDDEPNIVSSVSDVLGSFGFETISSSDALEGFKMAKEKDPDLIILDWMMPQLNGLQFTEDLRKEGYDIPILFLTAKGMLTVYEIEALRRGADDYMSKPFDPTLLVERVKALLKRSSRGTNDTKADNSKHTYCDGELVIDYDAMQVLVNGVSCDLTSNEFKLVQYLEQNAGRVCTRDELLSKVWNYAFSGDVRTVDVTVRRTRRKIEPNQPNYKYILTRRGSGYYFPKDFD